jgi:hypothetical protein
MNSLQIPIARAGKSDAPISEHASRNDATE